MFNGAAIAGTPCTCTSVRSSCCRDSISEGAVQTKATISTTSTAQTTVSPLIQVPQEKQVQVSVAPHQLDGRLRGPSLFCPLSSSPQKMMNNSNGGGPLLDEHHEYQLQQHNHHQRFSSKQVVNSLPTSAADSVSVCTNNSHHLWTTPAPPGAPKTKHIPCDPILDREHFSKRENCPTTFMRDRSREKRDCGGGAGGSNSPFSYFIHFSILVLVMCLCGFSIYIIWTDYMGVKSFIIRTESFVNPTRYKFPPFMFCNRALFNVDDHPYSKDSLISALRNASRSPANMTALNMLSVYNENYFYASFSSQFALFHSFKLEQFALLCKVGIFRKPCFSPVLNIY